MARIITIARGIGSGGRTVGKMLSEDMGIKYYDCLLYTSDAADE